MAGSTGVRKELAEFSDGVMYPSVLRGGGRGAAVARLSAQVGARTRGYRRPGGLVVVNGYAEQSMLNRNWESHV